MIIVGVECPNCGGSVIDNGDKCSHCKQPHPKEITDIQRTHSAIKMRNLEEITEGRLSIEEAVIVTPLQTAFAVTALPKGPVRSGMLQRIKSHVVHWARMLKFT